MIVMCAKEGCQRTLIEPVTPATSLSKSGLFVLDKSEATPWRNL